MVFFFIFLIFFPFISFAGSIGVVHIKADHISYNKVLNMYYAWGHSYIYGTEYSLKADYITYNASTDVVEAKGHVLLRDKSGDWIKGSYAKLNYSTYKGYVTKAVLFIKSDGLYVRADKIIIYSKNKYFIKNGALTSCKCNGFVNFKRGAYPKWTFSAPDTYIVKDKYLFAYPVVFRIRSVPSFFLPFVRKNLSKKRKTGFLMPQLGISSDKGFIYIQPFFINISPSEDFTLYPFVYSKKGKGVKGEYRFYWTRNSKGKWDITIFKDKVPYSNSNKRHTRINIKARQWANFGKYGYLRYSVNWVNNRNNLRVINSNNIQLSGDRYTTSSVSYYISRYGYFLSLYANYRQDLVAENNKNTLQDIPVVKFGVIGRKLYKNLTLDFTQTLANEFRVEGNRGVYTDTAPFVYYPLTLGYFKITPRVGFHQLWARWKSAPENEVYYYRSFIPMYSVSASTQLVGIFLNHNNKGFKGIKHTIKPTLSYEYVPERSQRFPDFVPFYPKTNLVTFTLENNLTAKYLDNGTSVYRDIFYNKLVIEYDFLKNYGTPFPPVYEETEVRPFSFLTLSSKSYYFFKKHVFTASTESLRVSSGKIGFTVGYSMSRDSSYNLYDKTVNGSVSFYPSKNLYVYASAKKSILYDYYPTREIGFTYHEDCWGVGLDVYFNRVSRQNAGNQYSTHLDRGFWITLDLTGLFNIKRQY